MKNLLQPFGDAIGDTVDILKHDPLPALLLISTGVGIAWFIAKQNQNTWFF